MSPTIAFRPETTFVHPLEISYNFSKRRTSISSDLSDQDQTHTDWHQLLSQFHSQPEMIQLIELCKIEEDRRRQEETKMKLKEYQVMNQLQYIRARQILEQEERKQN